MLLHARARTKNLKFVAIQTEARACQQEAVLNEGGDSVSVAPSAQPTKSECEHASRRLAANNRSRSSVIGSAEVFGNQGCISCLSFLDGPSDGCTDATCFFFNTPRGQDRS
jgi:hypothetical protein